ncbi:MAG TPA: PAS domain S-box protein, partial [Caldimonas sp.]|nr:PAS domain S-box protein [Caldimonas sp.]
RDEVVGRHWSERADAHDFERLLALIRGALDDRVGEATTTVTRADGSLFEIEVRYLPVHLDERRYALGIGRDVSERLQQERALQRSEAQYRGIFNASADALVLRDAAFRIVDVNATYESMSGYARDEVLGVDRVLANPPGVQSTIRELHERALAGTPITLETELVRRDGRRYALELRGVPIEHRGEPHVLYIGRDITVAKRAQAELRDSEEQYRAIFNASADGLVLRDKNYRAVDVNPAYLTITGFSREEVLAADRVLAQPDEATQRRHREQHDRILAGESVRFEAAGLRKDGSKVEVEVSAKPLMYRGEPHVLYAARDIGERREAEARSAELQLQLRQAQKMEAVGQLTGGIAHDFNNILTSVIGYVVLGLERAEALGDATLQRQLGQAHRAAQRARELIMQMLAFARRQRGERRALALAPLVQQSLQLLRATLPSSAVVDFVALDDVPNVLADPVQLEQVLFNLCINARDAIQGAGSIRVRLGWHRGPWRCASCRAAGEETAWVELSVADTGTGIAADLLERIFEPFVSTKEVGRGSGMGLAMVHGIVHDHGGHVLVETSQGAGTMFRVVLPPAGIDVPAEPRPATASAPVDPRHSLSGRVLLVEDESMVGDFMAELLTSWGLDVVLKREPLAALAWLEDPANAVDLLITDQTMPQLAGLALAKRATSLRVGLPVLLYSGNAESFDAAELERSNVRAALRKPVDAEKLRALVARWLGTERIASPG